MFPARLSGVPPRPRDPPLPRPCSVFYVTAHTWRHRCASLRAPAPASAAATPGTRSAPRPGTAITEPGGGMEGTKVWGERATYSEHVRNKQTSSK